MFALRSARRAEEILWTLPERRPIRCPVHADDVGERFLGRAQLLSVPAQVPSDRLPQMPSMMVRDVAAEEPDGDRS